jgi:hypothetical protein
MLFRTVYGPELPAVHAFLLDRGAASLDELHTWFIQGPVTTTEGTNLEEALAFLLSAGLLLRDHERTELFVAKATGNFQLSLLERLQAIYRNTSDAHPLDTWFMGLLDHCFIRPNRPFLSDVHTAANALELPVPCSEEKINAWRRVMEFLGCGRRIHGGFLACYNESLVTTIIRRWDSEGPLEEWLRFAEAFIPAYTETGDLATALAWPLEQLEKSGEIALSARGDFAGRSFLADRRVKWLKRRAS